MERRWKPRKPMTKDQLLGIANYLTYGRIAIVPIVIVIMTGINDDLISQMSLNRCLSWLAGIFFIVAMISDMVDGYYARKYNVISSFGKFIDPLADKLLSMSVLIMLIPLNRIAAWMVIFLIARETTITAVRSIAAAEGVEISASDWGKKKTLIQSFALGALLIHYPFWKFDPHVVGMILIWITMIASAGSGVHYIWSFFGEILERKKNV